MIACLLSFCLYYLMALNLNFNSIDIQIINKPKTKMRKLKIQNAKLCNDGPYVWDKSRHSEGIGATFDNRKYSLIAQGMLNAKWIGYLYNNHEVRKDLCVTNCDKLEPKEKLLKHTSQYFGLYYSECNYKSLIFLEKHKDLFQRKFIYTTAERCKGDKIFNACFGNIHIDKYTVLVFDWKDRRYDYNYAAFNKQFRYTFWIIDVFSKYEKFLNREFKCKY